MFNERVRIHYPTWTYDPDNTTDEVEIFIKNLGIQYTCNIMAFYFILCKNWNPLYFRMSKLQIN